MGGITTQLGTIQADVQEIKADQKITASTMVDLVGRMAIVERDIEKAHKRIDRLKGKKPAGDSDRSATEQKRGAPRCQTGRRTR